MQPAYDVVIVGGGSAGSVLANRLSADGTTRVLVLEAGRSDVRLDPFIHMPAALPFPIGNPLYDWRYRSEPEPHLDGRRIYHARGRVLGGSSSINGMIFQRGNPLDFERWAADAGMKEWDYAHCLPYFKRLETRLVEDGHAGADAWRGGSGPLVLERGPATNPLFGAFLEAVQQAGHPLTDDVNGYRQEGFAPFDRNVHRGRRLSAARAYLHPVRKRPNLTVETLAQVTGLRTRGSRVTGVDYVRGVGRRGVRRRVDAGEVILCGGAINSPQLLLLSGIGPAAELEALGIPVLADLPGVGRNLQDHLEVYVQHASKQPVSIGPWLRHRHKPRIGAEWLFLRRGVGASNHFEAGGFIRSNEQVDYPNLMFHFLPIAIRYDGSRPAADHGYQVHIGPMYSDVRGSLTLKSRDPFEHPALRFNYLSTETDRREWVEMVRAARHILEQPAFAAFSAGELSPGPDVRTDQEILDWVARDAETALHPSCTARMGIDGDSVLDPGSLRVHGLEGLRVVDASAMPYVTNGNIYAPVMMLAEKAADLIAGNEPLAPLHVPFYRHRDGSPLHPPGDPRNRTEEPA
ncbi:choline dehydrogenase [Nocardioides dongkuii]|uniref:choline dehydrogenase n=1 Tax=Nocardioides dongkuii TaxID=2760089 RepID=UPI0015FAD0DC|nr:choline dehydrogenase [Nocardioides dongkuii]